MLAACVAIVRSTGPTRFPWSAWLPFFVYLAWRTDFSDRDDVQRLAILATPVLLGVAGSRLPPCGWPDFRRAAIFVFTSAWIVYLLAAVSSASMLPTAWYAIAGPPMTMTFLAVVGIEDAERGRMLPVALVAGSWIFCVTTVARMPLLAIPAVVLLAARTFSGPKKVMAALAVLVLGYLLFTTEPVQQNLFRSGSGTLSELLEADPATTKSGGRLYAWPIYFAEIAQEPWIGHGGTATVEFGLENFGGWSHPHNEYIRLLFDYGIVGLVLFFGALLHLMLILRRVGRLLNPVSRLARVAFWSLVAFLLLCLTGNALLYVAWFGNIVYLAAGFALSGSRAVNPGHYPAARALKSNPLVRPFGV
jgi:O-antigen ligase